MFRRRTASLAALVAMLALVGTACSSDDGKQSVRDADRSMFVELPAEWTVFDANVLTEELGTPFVAQSADFTLPVLSRIVFGQTGDTSAVAAPATASLPVGSAVVRSISANQKQQLSRFLMSQSVVPYSDFTVSQEFLNQDVELAQDFDGIQVVVGYNDPDSGNDVAVTFISITDPEVTKLYTIAVGCTLECFGEHQETINEIVDSWLVNTR